MPQIVALGQQTCPNFQKNRGRIASINSGEIFNFPFLMSENEDSIASASSNFLKIGNSTPHHNVLSS
ncbi:hypothetical protein THS27_10280 [Thalassospira sp. MCCC 1A01428]|nr:hypothetical protein THS27_10280 [Thalassospira sp. MCCC 1A01428]